MPLLIVAVIALALVVALGVPAALKAGAVAGVSEECRAIQRELSTLGQGADPARREVLNQRLAQCARDLAATGASVDAVGIYLETAESAAVNIQSEWGNFKTTDYSDGIKRGTTRGTILRIAESSLIPALRQAVVDAQTPRDLERVKLAILRQIEASLDRAKCFSGDGPGCGRFGLNESNWDEKARDELVNITIPLGIDAALLYGWRPPAWKEAGRVLPPGGFMGQIPELYRLQRSDQGSTIRRAAAANLTTSVFAQLAKKLPRETYTLESGALSRVSGKITLL
jgi:hypothetical protein